MAKEVLEGMEGPSISKEQIIGILIMAFGIVMFVAGVQLGEYVQYNKDNNNIEWYKDNCLCTETFKIDRGLPQVNENFTIDILEGKNGSRNTTI